MFNIDVEIGCSEGEGGPWGGGIGEGERDGVLGKIEVHVQCSIFYSAEALTDNSLIHDTYHCLMCLLSNHFGNK